MYVNVTNEEGKQEVEGFEYTNYRGRTDRVRLKQTDGENYASGVIIIEEKGTSYKMVLWEKDIPKLIRALKAAQEHLGITE